MKSCLTLCNPMDSSSPGFSGVGCHFLLQEIFTTPISFIGRWVLYHWATFSSVQSLSHAQFFATPWTAARLASLSITNSQSLLKLMSIESVMPSNHLILCCPLLLPPSIFLSIRESQFFASGDQSIGLSASASVFPMNIQDYCLSDNQFVLYGILEGSGYVGKQPPVRGKKLKKMQILPNYLWECYTVIWMGGLQLLLASAMAL